VATYRGDWTETFRPDIPSPARIYDALLGGKDNYPADRAIAEKVLATEPASYVGVRQNRAFLRRAVRYLVAEAGVRQLLDIGTGLPTAGNVHEVAQGIDPRCRVVYVDNDPVVRAHALDLLHGTDNTAFIKHDLRDPGEILADAGLRGLLDFGAPVAVLLVAILHFIGDEDDPRGIIDRLLEPFPAGSYLVLSHVTADSRPKMAEVAKLYDQATSRFFVRTRDEVQALVAGLDLVEPGLVWLPQWRPGPDTGLLDEPGRSLTYGVVARKR
jgi:S-adenosyl methyltransferase